RLHPSSLSSAGGFRLMWRAKEQKTDVFIMLSYSWICFMKRGDAKFMSMVKSFIVTVVICGLVVSSSFAGIGVGSPSNKMVPSPEIIQIQALSSPGDVFP